MLNLDIAHYQHLKNSAIEDDIIALNFRSWDANSEIDRDDVFSLIVPDPKYRNNGTLSGSSQNNLANILHGGGWLYEGFMGVSMKPDCPRDFVDKLTGKTKTIKYESVRGCQQLFVPRVSIRAAITIASKLGVDREFEITHDPNSEDLEFWHWFRASGFPLIVTEGCKKACATISAGYVAIGLNGVWGWGKNDIDMFGNVERDFNSQAIKTLNPDLHGFVIDREVVLAFDFDTNPDTIATVTKASRLFAEKIADISNIVSQLKWTGSKGIDDLIVAKGVKNLDKIYAKRMEVKPANPVGRPRNPVDESEEKKKTPARDLAPIIVENIYRDVIRYDDELDQYWSYDDGIWSHCTYSYVYTIVQKYLIEIKEPYTGRLIDEVVKLARGFVRDAKWNEPDTTTLIPFKNGVLDIDSRVLLHHSPSYEFRWQLPRDYSHSINGWDKIMRFLDETSGGNKQLRNILLAFCNKALLGRDGLPKFLYLSGSGGNGKGVFLDLIKALVGEKNVKTTSLADLNENRFTPANIKDKRLVVCADEDKKPDSLTVFKSATGGDDISCEYKGKKAMDFKYEGIFVVAANKPIFQGENHEAMKRRKVDFPCLHQPIEKDDKLIEKLLVELPQFTSFVLGLDPAWVKKTITEASNVEAIASLAREMSIQEDNVAGYYHNRLVVDTESSSSTSMLYKDYTSYCDDNNLKPCNGNKFPKMLWELCNHSLKIEVGDKRINNVRTFIGIRMMTPLDTLPDADLMPTSADLSAGSEPLLRQSYADYADSFDEKLVYGNLINKLENIEEKELINLTNGESEKSIVTQHSQQTDHHKPCPETALADYSRSSEASINSAEASRSQTNLKPGDRVKGIYVPKSGIIDRIDRHPTIIKSSAMWARVIMNDGVEWWAELDVITKITETNAT